jgi:AraC-like DNA-binding protein
MSTFDELSRSIDVARSEITRVELGGPWGKHRRSVPGSARLYAALGGAGRVEVPGQPGQHVRLGPGELAFLPRNDEHVIRDAPATFIPRDGSACVGMRQADAHVWVSEPAPTASLVIVELGLDARDAPWLELLAPLVHVTQQGDGLGRWLRETLALLAGAHEPSSSLRQEIATTWARALFARALRDASAALPGADAARDERIVAALVQVRARPDKHWELGELATRAGVSRSVLAERMTALLGEPLGQYLRRVRIDRAATLLASTDTPVKTIASRVGYDSEPAFTRAFSRMLGATPTAYRRAHRASAGPA